MSHNPFANSTQQQLTLPHSKQLHKKGKKILFVLFIKSTYVENLTALRRNQFGDYLEIYATEMSCVQLHYLTIIALQVLLIFCCEGSYVPFLRKSGTLDAMDSVNDMADAYLPLQQVPIYGHECLKRFCWDRRFLTVRHGNDRILIFSNHWTTTISYVKGYQSIRCPKHMLAMGMSCLDTFCDAPQLLCAATAPGFKVNSWRKKDIKPTNKSGKVLCPDGMYVQGLICTDWGWKCNPMGLHCVALVHLRTPQHRYPLISTSGRVLQSERFGSRGKGYSQLMSGPVFGMECLGLYCDSISLFSVARGTKPLLQQAVTWTPSVNAAGSSVQCPLGMVVGQMRCGAQNCGDVYLGCVRPFPIIQINKNDRQMSNIFGESFEPPGHCPDGYFMDQLFCLRNKCAQMAIGCVKLTFIE